MKAHTEKNLVFAILRSGLLGAIGQGYGCDRRLFGLAADKADKALFDAVVADIFDDIGDHYRDAQALKKIDDAIMMALGETDIVYTIDAK